MRVLRWAAELAVDPAEAQAELGVTQLRALSASPLLDDQMAPMVDAALTVVVKAVSDDLREGEETGRGDL